MAESASPQPKPPSKPRGGAGRKRTQKDKFAERNAVAKRRLEVARLAIKRVSLPEIAEKLGSGKSTISRDMKFVRLDWARESKEKIGHVVAQELAALEADENELRKQFDALGMTEDDGGELRIKVHDRILRIMERRAKLLGLDAPNKQQVSGPGGGPIAIDAEVRRSRVDVKVMLADPSAVVLVGQLLERIETTRNGSAGIAQKPAGAFQAIEAPIPAETEGDPPARSSEATEAIGEAAEEVADPTGGESVF